MRGLEVKLFGMREMNFWECRDPNGRRGGFRLVCGRELGSGAGSCEKIPRGVNLGGTRDSLRFCQMQGQYLHEVQVNEQLIGFRPVGLVVV